MLITTADDAAGPQWMECPQVETDLPTLAFFYPLDELIVAERRDVLHDIIGLTGVGYTVFNNKGQKVFLAVLEKHFKKFDIKIFNHYGNEVVHVKRPFHFCTKKVLVWSPPGNFVGSVKEVKTRWKTYIVKDRVDKDILKIVPAGIFNYMYNIQLVYDGTVAGVIRKQSDVVPLDVKHFAVSFPIELDVRDKAVLLGACFMVGFRY
ncbi:unnamed protein product [Chrysodeixis includens]|uniref:Phospholipid scramblase n=1 Tax=Chrysodeixis includens TaxID=689277 RepID=A0A9P0FUV1_CHRIL|nr:unnamed protein product [Chrysodeixis includens]